jgi:DUF4097 and DUF4098 domain-containing protein YvlB
MAAAKLFPVRILLSTIPLILLASCCGKSHHRGMTVVSAHSDGPVSIHQMGGDIDVKEAPQGANLETMGGNIRLGQVDSAARLHTMGGNITVEHAGGSVDAQTMGGEIRINSAFGPIKASTMGGGITAHVVGSSKERRDIELSSKSGVIALTVPKDFPMEIRVTLAYTKNSSQDFRISEHLGLTQKVSPDWESNFGTPRKFIRATGRVGNGQNRVTIDTINGDVIIRQE